MKEVICLYIYNNEYVDKKIFTKKKSNFNKKEKYNINIKIKRKFFKKLIDYK